MSEPKPDHSPKALRVTLITKQLEELPPWVAAAAADVGLNLTVHRCETHADLQRHAGEAEVIWTVGANTCLTADILPQLPLCRAIMRSGSGLDDLPVEAAQSRGLLVANTPEAIAETVAEHTVAMLLGLVRRLAEHDRAVRRGEWYSGPDGANWHVRGQTLGLIGFGLIAREVVSMLQGFRMRFLAHDPYASTADICAQGVEPVTLEALLRGSDFVSLHCPLTPQTRGLLNEKALAQMKPGALLINTSRGGVADEAALVAALQNGPLGGAALDVLEEEPPPPDHPLLQMEQVLLTPHIAAFSDVFEDRFWQASITKLKQLEKQIKETKR